MNVSHNHEPESQIELDWNALRYTLLQTSVDVHERQALKNVDARSKNVDPSYARQRELVESLRGSCEAMAQQPPVLLAWLRTRRDDVRLYQTAKRKWSQVALMLLFIAVVGLGSLYLLDALQALILEAEETLLSFGPRRSQQESTLLAANAYALRSLLTTGVLPALFMLLAGAWLIIRLVLGPAIGEYLLTRIPLIGENTRLRSICSYLSLLSSLRQAGVEWNEACQLSAQSLGSNFSRKWAGLISQRVQSGCAFEEALRDNRWFDNWMVKLLASSPAANADWVAIELLSRVLRDEIALRSSLVIQWFQRFMAFLVIGLTSVLVFLAGCFVMLMYDQMRALI